MGNPHAVLFTKDIYSLDLEKTGPLFENHELFPNRINTEFIEVLDSRTLNMRVWERGSGETYACGTGACASAVAAVLNGYCKHDEETSYTCAAVISLSFYRSDETVSDERPCRIYSDGTVDDQYINELKENAVCRS